MSLNPIERRRWRTLAAVTPLAFLAILAAIWLLYEAPFLRAGAWATGICLVATAVLLPALAVLARDVSGRRQAEQALRRNEERLRQVSRVSQIGIFDHDHLTGEIYWSPEQREIYGWGADEPVVFSSVTGKDWQTWDLIHPEDRDRVAAALKRAHTTEEGPFDVEYRVIRRDGNLRWVTTRSQTFFEGEGAARRAVRTIGAVQDITERKRAERQLELTQASIDKSDFAIFWVSPTGQVTYGNQHGCESLGLTRQELIGQSVWDFDPDFKPEHWAESWQELKRAKVLRSETRHRRKDGTIFPVETTGAYVVFEGEEHAFVFAHDITQRQRAERELKLMLAAIDSSRTPFYAIDPHERIVYANEHAWLTLGLTREELVGRHVWDIDPDYHPESQAEYWNRIRKVGEIRFETRHRRKDGTTLPVEVTANLFSYKDEEYSLVFAQDITERKRAERALRESEERLRQVAHVYDIGVFDHDHLTGALYWSPELRRCLGLSADERIELSQFIKAIHPQDSERVEAAVERALDPSGDGRLDVQHRIVTPDGSIRWLESRSQTFFEGEGSSRRRVRTVGAMVDITARVAAEETLRESLREKETLLREVHHRVKNNLQIIASLLHFQAKKIKNPEDLAAFFEGRDRLRSMILVHEKLYQSRGLARIDFGNYLKSLAGELTRSLGERSGKRVDVRVTADEIALPIESALPCGMIVCELLTNIFKYAFPGDRSGSAHLQLVAHDGRVRLTVTDDGVGLPADFDPEHSTSFGWQLIHNLAAQLGGTLSVASEEGTRVSISFPRRFG
jgi:PAS domain S-box-containing protein